MTSDYPLKIKGCSSCRTHAHFECVERYYSEWAVSTMKCESCKTPLRVFKFTALYTPSIHHSPWLSLTKARPKHFELDDVVYGALMRSFNTPMQRVEELEESYFIGETKLSWWSEKALLLVFTLCLFGIAGMALGGGFDWRMEVGYWTFIGLVFIAGITLSPECLVYFYSSHTKKTRAVALKSNNGMFVSHFLVLCLYFISYMVMITTTVNSYSIVWNGTMITSFIVCLLVIIMARRRKVAGGLSSVTFLVVPATTQASANLDRRVSTDSEPKPVFTIDEPI